MKEEWKDYNLNGLTYRVSNYGKIIGKRGLLKQRLNRDGYWEVTIGLNSLRSAERTHRIVAKLFVDNPMNFPEVNHIDFDRKNCRADNLEWTTHIENVRYSSKAGRLSEKARGVNNVRAILSEEDVKNIRELYKSGNNIAEIARMYKRGWQTINHIIKGTTWKHV